MGPQVGFLIHIAEEKNKMILHRCGATSGFFNSHN